MGSHVERWAVEWHSKNRLNGETRQFLWNGEGPFLFHTRREARAVIKDKWGYIATRADLRREPHGWRMPQAVRVSVILERLQKVESQPEKE